MPSNLLHQMWFDPWQGWIANVVSEIAYHISFSKLLEICPLVHVGGLESEFTLLLAFASTGPTYKAAGDWIGECQGIVLTP
jgi:hypothetical protein